jgi:hypothetical protein
MGAQLFDMSEHSLHELASGFGLIEGYVVGDAVEIVESRFGPNYLNHRAKRFLAWE